MSLNSVLLQTPLRLNISINVCGAPQGATSGPLLFCYRLQRHSSIKVIRVQIQTLLVSDEPSDYQEHRQLQEGLYIIKDNTHSPFTGPHTNLDGPSHLHHDRTFTHQGNSPPINQLLSADLQICSAQTLNISGVSGRKHAKNTG